MKDTQLMSANAAVKKDTRWQLAFFVLLSVVITALVLGVVVYQTLFIQKFNPVELSQNEKQLLDQKIHRFEAGRSRQTNSQSNNTPLQPEPYSEAGSSREVHLTERELNALLANHTDLASRVAIDLSRDLASALILVSVEPDMPILGGKTIKISAGLGLAYVQGAPVVMLEGVSIWGVPVPGAWLGGLKNIDVVKEFGQSGGFWQAVAAGIERVEVMDGAIHLVLKE